MRHDAAVRVAVYTDYAYHADGDRLYAERAFALFLVRLSRELERLVLVGRVRRDGTAARYRIPDSIPFVGLPYYESLVRPLPALRAMTLSVARFWRALDGVDAVWLLGPHPLSLVFAAAAAVRRRRVMLGVREDLPVYVANRHPGRRSLLLSAKLLELAYRALALACPTVVVGPDLLRRYRHAPRSLEMAVSLVDDEDIVPPEVALARTYDGELVALTVGRLEREKNPLMLAEVLRRLEATGGHWRLVVCGEGPMDAELAARLSELGLRDRADLRGYVPFGHDLMELYRGSHAFLHVSWTEGFPQVLVEAFAAGLPVVATDVGGVRAAVGSAALLVPPGDPDAAAEALRRIASEPALRERLIRAGTGYVREHSQGEEARRLAAFLERG